LKKTVLDKFSQYNILVNEKSELFEEMHQKALIMINRDQQILKNEQEIVYLKHTIDINILDVEQKTAIIQDLEKILAQRKAEYKQLKEEIKILEQQIEELIALLRQKEGEYETLEDVLRDKNQIIEGLEKAIGEKAPET
jgi:chromosome segregation ATPase